jgi:hypothetical protein
VIALRRLQLCPFGGPALAAALATLAAATAAPAAFIPATARVNGPGVGPGLRGEFYDRNDPPNTIVSLAIADGIIASDPVAARFTATLVDYPNGAPNTLFLPTVGALLGADAASLTPGGAAGAVVSPSVWRLSGFIQISPSFDTIAGNGTIDVRFGLGSDDGSRLRIGGQTIVSIDGGGIVVFPGVAGLAEFEAPGLYPLEVVWYDHYGGVGLEFSSSIPGGPNSGGPAGTVGIVPTSVLFQQAVPVPPTLALLGTGGAILLVGARRRLRRRPSGVGPPA